MSNLTTLFTTQDQTYLFDSSTGEFYVGLEKLDGVLLGSIYPDAPIRDEFLPSSLEEQDRPYTLGEIVFSEGIDAGIESWMRQSLKAHFAPYITPNFVTGNYPLWIGIKKGEKNLRYQGLFFVGFNDLYLDSSLEKELLEETRRYGSGQVIQSVQYQLQEQDRFYPSGTAFDADGLHPLERAHDLRDKKRRRRNLLWPVITAGIAAGTLLLYAGFVTECSTSPVQPSGPFYIEQTTKKSTATRNE